MLRPDYAPWKCYHVPISSAPFCSPPEDHVRVGAEHCQTEEADGETFSVIGVLGCRRKGPVLW